MSSYVIICHQYGISVADVPPGETFLAARRYEKRLYSQAKRWGAHQKIKIENHSWHGYIRLSLTPKGDLTVLT